MSDSPVRGDRLARASLSRQACDGCKRRKVKCDSKKPCSSCQTSTLRCEYTTLNRKRGPAKAPDALESSAATRLHYRPYTQPDLASASSATDGVGPSSVSPSQPTTSSENASPYSASAAEETVSPGFGRSSASLLGFPENNSAALIVQTIRDSLLESLRAAVPTERPQSIVDHCIDLFMRYVFPSTPVIHEASMRKHSATYFADNAQLGNLFADSNERDRVNRMRSFALVAALCSNVSATMGRSLLHYGELVAAPFFHASNRVLKTYEEYDIEFPNSSSIIIRSLLSGAAQHITGKNGFAVHVYGQAALLALSLRLYNEEALLGPEPSLGRATASTAHTRRDPIEVQLLRQNFWHIFMSDKSATSLETRPALLQEAMFVGGLTVEYLSQPLGPLLDLNHPLYGNAFEERMLVCCNLILRLWSTACDLLQRIKVAAVPSTPGDRSSFTSMLMGHYLQFVTIIEDLPPWLQLSSLSTASAVEDTVGTFQNDCFWVQRCTLFMSYHCLQVVIMQRCIEVRLVDILGIRNDSLSIGLKKADLIQGFVQALEDIPFIYHQVKGESSVQRIRIVGSILLEMVQNAEHEILQPRIALYLRRLLDVLAKLDSKASEDLNP